MCVLCKQKKLTKLNTLKLLSYKNKMNIICLGSVGAEPPIIRSPRQSIRKEYHKKELIKKKTQCIEQTFLNICLRNKNK